MSIEGVSVRVRLRLGPGLIEGSCRCWDEQEQGVRRRLRLRLTLKLRILKQRRERGMRARGVRVRVGWDAIPNYIITTHAPPSAPANPGRRPLQSHVPHPRRLRASPLDGRAVSGS